MEWKDLAAYCVDYWETGVSFTFVLVLFLASRWTSVTVTLTCWVVFEVLMELSVSLLSVINRYQPELVIHVQYIFWMCMNLGLLITIFKCHKRSKIEVSKYALFVCLTGVLLSLLQFIRLVDRFIIETNLLAEVYRYGILTLNLGPALFVAPMVLMSFYSYLFKRVNRL